MGTTRSTELGNLLDDWAERLTAVRQTTSPGHHWIAAPTCPIDFRDPAHPIPVSVVGTHGGAGTSTVARLLTATDAERAWPTPADGRPPRVVLVARTHATGLMAASQALAVYCAHGYPEGTYLVGFVLVADAPGRLPKPLSRRIPSWHRPLRCTGCHRYMSGDLMKSHQFHTTPSA